MCFATEISEKAVEKTFSVVSDFLLDILKERIVKNLFLVIALICHLQVTSIS